MTQSSEWIHIFLLITGLFFTNIQGLSVVFSNATNKSYVVDILHTIKAWK